MLTAQIRGSAAESAEAAAAEAERRIGGNERTTRTRAALGTLANRRVEAEHDHAAAVIAGDHTKLGDARREVIDGWRAERRARGDGEAEINAGARGLDAQYRKTALQHRLVQSDEAGLKRALTEEDDAKADPATARAVADAILRLRRDDPARSGEGTIERQIAERKRDGRIDTHEEKAAARFRLNARARRRIAISRNQVVINESARGGCAVYRLLARSKQESAPSAHNRRTYGMPRISEADVRDKARELLTKSGEGAIMVAEWEADLLEEAGDWAQARIWRMVAGTVMAMIDKYQ